MSLTCRDCGKPFERRSPRGRAPSRCYECRDADPEVKRLRELGRPVKPDTSAKALAAEEARRVAREIQPEASWLDAPELQDLVIARAQREDVPAPDADASMCSAPVCASEPDRPLADPRFCLAHWLQLDIEIQGGLVNTPPGSSPFNSNLIRAIRSLR